MTHASRLTARQTILGDRTRRQPLFAAAAAAAATLSFALVLVDGASEGGDLSSYDPSVTASAVSERTGPLTLAAEVLSFVGSEVSVGVLTVAVLAWLVVGHRAWRTAWIVGGSMALAGVMTLAIKHLVLRPRPPAMDVLGSLDHGYSFPSGHTLFSTAFFGLVAGLVVCGSGQVWMRWAVLSGWVLVSAAIGLSRLYLGYHWLTDILAGWSLGMAVLALAAAAAILTQPVSGHRDDSRPFVA